MSFDRNYNLLKYSCYNDMEMDVFYAFISCANTTKVFNDVEVEENNVDRINATHLNALTFVDLFLVDSTIGRYFKSKHKQSNVCWTIRTVDYDLQTNIQNRGTINYGLEGRKNGWLLSLVRLYDRSDQCNADKSQFFSRYYKQKELSQVHKISVMRVFILGYKLATVYSKSYGLSEF